MLRLLDELAAVDVSRLVAGVGSLVVLLVLGGWFMGAVNGSALAGQVAAATGAFLISTAALLYAFRLAASPASD